LDKQASEQAGEAMTRASIRIAATALTFFFAAALRLQADDPLPVGGNSPFGKALDDQKIREDFAKLRLQLEQSQGDVLKNKGARFHRWTKSGTRSSAPKQSTLQNNLIDPRRDRQRDRLQRDSSKRSPSSSSSRGSGSGTPAS
jgi:hypothetical protein